MYKNLCAEALGISGRQSELIELTLSYGFRGFDLDLGDVIRRAQSQGSETALRFLQSAGLKIGGFELPIRLYEDEGAYKSDLVDLPKAIELAKSLNAERAISIVPAATDSLPFNELFEQSRRRITEVADMLKEHEIKLGLGFHAAASRREELQFQFIHQAETLVTLIKMIGAENVGLSLDLWNWRVGGGGCDQLRDLSGNQIVNVTLADVPADADLTTIEESQRVLPEVSEESEAVKVLTILGEQQYNGPVTLAVDAGQFTNSNRDQLVQEVSKKLDELFKAAGINKAGKLVAPAEA